MQSETAGKPGGFCHINLPWDHRHGEVFPAPFAAKMESSSKTLTAVLPIIDVESLDHTAPSAEPIL